MRSAASLLWINLVFSIFELCCWCRVIKTFSISLSLFSDVDRAWGIYYLWVQSAMDWNGIQQRGQFQPNLQVYHEAFIWNTLFGVLLVSLCNRPTKRRWNFRNYQRESFYRQRLHTEQSFVFWVYRCRENLYWRFSWYRKSANKLGVALFQYVFRRVRKTSSIKRWNASCDV